MHRELDPVERPVEAVSPPPPEPRAGRTRSVAAALAGPALIVAAVLWPLRDFAFHGRSTSRDVVRFWLPMWTEMGRNLRAGHLLAWTPHVVGGMPFAADPHSGWLQIVPMALFTTLPAAVAIAWAVIAHPVIAGLGLYAFLRSEGLSRPAATVAGLALALPLATTRLTVTLRFPGSLAWTVVALACASHAVKPRSRSSRVAWIVATAVAWGQIAASHLTVGFGVGTAALFAYLGAAAWNRRGSGPFPWARAARLGALLLVAMVAINVAVIYPRLALAGRTNLARGYDWVSSTNRELTGLESPPYPGKAGRWSWGLNFAMVPGPYLGAAVLGLSLLAWRSRRRRPLVVAFGVLGALCYVGSVESTARFVDAHLSGLPSISQYLHAPEWTGIGVLLSLAVLAGAGLEAAREEGRAAWTIPAAFVVFPLLALSMGHRHATLVPIAAGGAVATVLLLVRRGWATALVPLLVAVEALTPVTMLDTRDFGRRLPPLLPSLEILYPMRPRDVVLADRTRPGNIATALEGADARYVTLAPHSRVQLDDPNALQHNESQIFGLENVGGYRAVEPLRIWQVVRALDHEPVQYNVTAMSHPKPVLLDLLQVGWLIANHPPPGAIGPVAEDPPWGLYRRPDAPLRASLVGAWTRVAGLDAAIAEIGRSGFDPATEAVLEGDPGVASPAGGAGSDPGTATWEGLGPQAARVEVDALRPSILLVRTAFDPGWHATLDGRPVPILPADALDQGIAVPAGHHQVRLAYDDPSIRRGLAASALGLIGLGGWWAILRRRERRERRGAGSAAT